MVFSLFSFSSISVFFYLCVCPIPSLQRNIPVSLFRGVKQWMVLFFHLMSLPPLDQRDVVSSCGLHSHARCHSKIRGDTDMTPAVSRWSAQSPLVNISMAPVNGVYFFPPATIRLTNNISINTKLTNASTPRPKGPTPVQTMHGFLPVRARHLYHLPTL